MVHALLRAKRILKTGGTLIVVHDTPFPPYIEIRQGTSRSPAGWLHNKERFPLIRTADKAVETVIDAGHIMATSQAVFLYQKQIQSYEGFCDWLDRKWETSFLPIHTNQLIRDSFLGGESGTIVTIHRQARIQSLRSIQTPLISTEAISKTL